MRWFYLVMMVGCGGPAFESASLAISPGDGNLSKDSPTGLDGTRNPSVDAAPGEFGAEANEHATTLGADASAPLSDGGPVGEPSAVPREDSHVSDPWPTDVVVEPMPGPNCFMTFGGALSCCYGPNVPPIDCAQQNQAHHCDQCPAK